MRLFVAFDLPAALKRAVEELAAPQRAGLPTARWVNPETLHINLSFLGAVDPDRIDGLRRALAEAFAPWPSLDLALGGLGAFPPRGAPRVLWLGVETAGDLTGIQAAVAGTVARQLDDPRLIDERPYRPHLTLARCKARWRRDAVERLESALAPVASLPPFTVAEGALFASHLGPSGARYEIVETFPLRG